MKIFPAGGSKKTNPNKANLPDAQMTGTDMTGSEYSVYCRQSSFIKAKPRKMALPANTMPRKAGWIRA